MPGSQNIINALKQYTGASHNEATIAANREVSAFDPEKSLFVQGSGRRAAASPTVHYQRSREIRGEMESTGRIGDLAIDKGQGMFAIKTRTGTVALSNMGSFRVSEVEQKIVGPSGEILMGWMLDADGDIPANSSSLESLTELSIKQLAAEAVATDRVNISANLRQEQLSKDGPGGQAEFSVHSVSKMKDLILPGEVGTKSTLLGDKLVLTPTAGNGVRSEFELGGMTISRKPSGGLGGAIYGATSASNTFNITVPNVAPTSADQLEHGQGFTITVGANGGTFKFSASKAGTEAHLGRFNSLNNLAEAINLTTNGKIRATVTDNRLVVSAKDANDSLTFAGDKTPGGRDHAHQVLGLIDVTAAPVDAKRYASPQELRDKVKATDGLNARIEGKKVIFSSHVATAALSINGESSLPRNYRSVFAVTLGGGDATSRNAIAIESSSHNLQTGDYIRLAGTLSVNAGNGARLVDNKSYRVIRLSSDRFAIAIQGDLTTAAALTTPVAGARLNIAATADQSLLTWRKLEGTDTAKVEYSPNARTTSEIQAESGGAGNLARVRIAPNSGLNDLNRFATGDKVFISGSTLVLDGVYNIIAVDATNFDIAARHAGGAAGFASDFVNGANGGSVVPAAPDGGMRVVKVAAKTGANAMDRLDPYPVQITASSRTVRVHMPAGRTVSRGDVIKLAGLAGDTAVFQGMTFRNNGTYTVTQVDPAGLFYEFELPLADAPRPGATSNGYIGYEDALNDADVIQVGALAAGVATNQLGLNARFENLGKMFSGFGMGADEAYLDDPQEATYSFDIDSGKTMASGNIKPHKTFGTTVLDSFGRGHIVNISYLRLDNNKWAVEIWVPANKDGTYDVSGNNLLKSATLEFDDKGRLPSGSIPEVLKDAIDIPWNNGSAPGSVKFDFGDEIDDQGITKSGITMNAGEYDLRFLDPNGNKAGVVESIRYDEDGKVIAIYSNGSSRAFAQLPVAIVQDFNSLIAIGNGHYVVAPNKSGNVILKQAGVGGAGTFMPGFLEASKADENEALLNMTELNHLRSIALKAVAKEEEINKLAVQLL